MSTGTFPELSRLESLAARYKSDLVRPEVLDSVGKGKRIFPILGLVIGARDRRKPTFGLFGGVHGLENVGTHVIIAYLETLLEQLRWDRALRRLFEDVRLATIPLVNPVGMFLQRRSNGNGVDLNRNAPVEAEKAIWLAGGHRLGSFLPWYRGKYGAPMEREAQVLTEFVERELFGSEFSIALDCHSGFGIEDQLWYPYARTKKPFPKLREALAFKELWDRTHPYHFYRIEPQSRNYTSHGDLWDYLFDRHLETQGSRGHFLPWTLEMGSWQWVRKNPRQILSALGPFNPIKPHRYKRIMRRHLPLMNFFLNAASNHDVWAGPS